MEKKKINAEIIADSTNEHGQRITTFVLTYPRMIHAELLTHRLFSRNAASSRAIPAKKMIDKIRNEPFIPVAFQKEHSGMQGTEYWTDEVFEEGIHKSHKVAKLIQREWFFSMQRAVEKAEKMKNMGCTKQLVNRLLEPFQWYTCIVTATEFDNFFKLRCPQYEWDGQSFKSRKDCLDVVNTNSPVHSSMNTWDDLSWLKINKGQGEIHISLLAEAMWDARNDSEPKQLKEGEWHIPFGDKIEEDKIWKISQERVNNPIEEGFPDVLTEIKIKVATARCARVSYLNYEGKDDYEADIKLYDRLLSMGHMSPFEHCARAMSEEEYRNNFRGDLEKVYEKDEASGWSGNFRGFVQLRKEIE